MELTNLNVFATEEELVYIESQHTTLMMKRYLINLLTFKVTETTLKPGLQLNKKNFAYGFVVESTDLVTATDQLNAIEEKWRTWVSDYNTWVGLPAKEQAKFQRTKA